MLKKFSPKPEPLDDLKYTKPLTMEQLENELAYALDYNQIYASTDDELKALVDKELHELAKKKSLSTDETYAFMEKNYPYTEYSRWHDYTDEQLEVWINSKEEG